MQPTHKAVWNQLRGRSIVVDESRVADDNSMIEKGGLNQKVEHVN